MRLVLWDEIQPQRDRCGTGEPDGRRVASRDQAWREERRS